ncbi:MAG TPA: hypothetical protein VNQ73_20870 [Ilumatobacter sp.]|nr:hypothetical protein [Ilumatobacter sp.]
MLIHRAARKWGVPDDDMRHAVRNPLWVFPQDGYEIFVGPDRAGLLLEVGLRENEHGETVIFHAMPARPKFTR